MKPLAFGPGVDPAAAYWTAYTIRSGSAAACQISVAYSATQDGELKTVVDGAPLEAISIQNTAGTERRTAPLTVRLGAGIHSVRLQSTRGEFTVRSLQVDAAVPATPVPAVTPMPVETPLPLPTATPEEKPALDPGLAPDEAGTSEDSPAIGD